MSTRFTTLLCAGALALLAAACGHGTSATRELQPVPGGLGDGFPAPAAVLRETESIYDELLFTCGNQFVAPSRNTEGLGYPGAATNLPQCGILLDASRESEPGDWRAGMAWATYVLGGLADYAGDSEIKFGLHNWGGSEAAVYAGVGNLVLDRWEWHAVPDSGRLDLPSFEPFLSADGELVVIVVAMQDKVVEWVLVGDNMPLSVLLSATLHSGEEGGSFAPLPVSFRVQLDSVGSAGLSCEWDFESDGVWDVTTADLIADHIYEYYGAYTCTVRATDDEGQTALATCDVFAENQDNQPPQAQLSAEVDNSAFPAVVQFDASGTVDEAAIAAFAWDFEGDGYFEYESGTSPIVTHAYGRRGQYEARVLVRDDHGLDDTGSVSIDIETGFESVPVHSGHAYSLSITTSGSGAGERACLAFVDNNASGVWFSRALDASGSAWTTPLRIDQIDPEFWGLAAISTVPATGAPVVAYTARDTSGYDHSLRVVAATDETGSAWGTPVLVEDARNLGGLALAIEPVDGRLCVATIEPLDAEGFAVTWYASLDGSAANFAAAPDPLPVAAGLQAYYIDFVPVPEGGGEVPLLAVSGQMYAGATERLLLLRGDEPLATAWDTVAQYDATGGQLLVAPDGPMLFTASVLMPQQAAALSADGSLWPAQLTPCSFGAAGPQWTAPVGCALVGGRPVIVLSLLWQLHIVVADDAAATSWGVPANIHPGDVTGALASVGGQPVAAVLASPGVVGLYFPP